MWTIFRYAMKRSWIQILVWGFSLAMLAAYVVILYDTFSGQQSQFSQLLAAYPPELMAAFGGTLDLFIPPGYLNFTFFSYIWLILGFFVVLTGSGLLVGDEENGTLDLVLAYPVSRTAIYFGRLAAFILAILAILLISWLGFIITLPSTKLGLGIWALALPHLDLFASMLFFGVLSLLLSMLLPSRRVTAMTASLLLVASFFLTTLARLDENLEVVEKISPLHYFRGGYAVEGLEWSWFLGLLGISLLLVLLAWWRFLRRDIRVGGEGGWGLRRLRYNRQVEG